MPRGYHWKRPQKVMGALSFIIIVYSCFRSIHSGRRRLTQQRNLSGFLDRYLAGPALNTHIRRQ
jgi:hypothetical protein